MRRARGWLAVAIGLSACNFTTAGGYGDRPALGEPDLDAQPAMDDGVPEPEGPMPGDRGDDAADDAANDDAGGTDDGQTPLPPPGDPSHGDDDDGEGTDGGASDDGVPDACAEPIVELLWSADADLVAPMQLAAVPSAIDEPSVAVSVTPEEGQVVFTLDLPCAGDYYAYGLVWDYAPGAWSSADPDSLYVSVGGPSDMVWRYGCQTLGQNSALSWQGLERLDAQPCETTPIVLHATAPGVYALTLRNREAGFGSVVAGIAALLITTDPQLDPYDQYDPY